MKKVKLNGKLNLNKTTIATLNQKDLESVKGGVFFTDLCESFYPFHCDEKPVGKKANPDGVSGLR